MQDKRSKVGLLLMVLIGLWLVGCATPIPAPILGAPAWVPTPDEVRANPARFEGVAVRWGGVIAGVENRVDYTLVEVVSRPLSRSGRPRDIDAGHGRFLARVPGFLDPAVFVAGRELTVTGRVAGMKFRPVGDYDYPYVLVDVGARYLWPVRDSYHYDPLWHYRWDPYSAPFYRPWPH